MRLRENHVDFFVTIFYSYLGLEKPFICERTYSGDQSAFQIVKQNWKDAAMSRINLSISFCRQMNDCD